MRQWLQKRPIQPAQEQAPQKLGPSSGISNQAVLSMLECQDTPEAPRPASGGTPLDKAMQAKIERQFGLPMGDVRIHRNSDEPAKFDAGAYTYGTDIFIGPGHEKLLNHEMTHVAQQKLGQVRPTGVEHGMAVNRSPVLEHSADLGTVSQVAGSAAGPVVQCGDDDEDQSVTEPPTKKPRGTYPFEVTAAQQDAARAVATMDQTPESVEKVTATTTEEQIPMPTEAAAAASMAGGLGCFTSAELNEGELTVDEERLFTSENFKGASMSDDKVGSIYFGGTSFDDIDIEDTKKTEVMDAVIKYLINRKTEQKEETKQKLFDILSTLEIKLGGRIRFVHNHGPEISQHQHVLRMNDPREGKEGKLLEIFFEESADSLHTHPSRGALIPFPSGDESAPTLKKAGDERTQQDIVRDIRGLSEDEFSHLAKEAKAAQAYVQKADKKAKEAAKKAKKSAKEAKKAAKEAAKDANRSFTAKLGDDLVKKIGTRTQEELEEENRRKEEERKAPKRK